MVVKTEPKEITFEGPFDRPTRAVLKATNTGPKRVIIKVKVSECSLIRARPVYAFIKSGQQLDIVFQTSPFNYTPADGMKKRKAAISFAVPPDNVNDACLYARQLKKNAWQQVKIPIHYSMPQGSLNQRSQSTTQSTTTVTVTQKSVNA